MWLSVSKCHAGYILHVYLAAGGADLQPVGPPNQAHARAALPPAVACAVLGTHDCVDALPSGMPDHAVNVPEKGFHKLSLDPCYAFYEESLKCLDRNNYSHAGCSEAFQAFKDCRSRQGERDAEERVAVLQQDPLLGWVARWYSGKLAQYQQQTAALAGQQQPAAEEEELPEWKKHALAQEAEQQRQQQQQQQQQQAATQPDEKQHPPSAQHLPPPSQQQQQQQPDQVIDPGHQRRSWWRRS